VESVPLHRVEKLVVELPSVVVEISENKGKE